MPPHNTICRVCGHRWEYTGKQEHGTCPHCRKTVPANYTPTLLEYHMQNSLPVVTYAGGKSYVIVPKDDDLWGNLETVLKCATVDGWEVIEKNDVILIPTYAYDRVVVAGLRCRI